MHENQYKYMCIYDLYANHKTLCKSIQILNTYANLRKSMQIVYNYKTIWNCLKIITFHEHIWQSMNIIYNYWTSITIFEHLSKPMTIHENNTNQWTVMTTYASHVNQYKSIIINTNHVNPCISINNPLKS